MKGKYMVERISPISVRGTLSVNFFQYFVIKNFKHTEKLKEFCSKCAYTHCLDSRIILRNLRYHISIRLPFPLSIINPALFDKKLQASVLEILHTRWNTRHKLESSICCQLFLFLSRQNKQMRCSDLKETILWVSTNAYTCVPQIPSRPRALQSPRKFPDIISLLAPAPNPLQRQPWFWCFYRRLVLPVLELHTKGNHIICAIVCLDPFSQNKAFKMAAMLFHV